MSDEAKKFGMTYDLSAKRVVIPKGVNIDLELDPEEVEPLFAEHGPVDIYQELPDGGLKPVLTFIGPKQEPLTEEAPKA